MENMEKGNYVKCVHMGRWKRLEKMDKVGLKKLERSKSTKMQRWRRVMRETATDKKGGKVLQKLEIKGKQKER